jgi:hypothetical protein
MNVELNSHNSRLVECEKLEIANIKLDDHFKKLNSLSTKIAVLGLFIFIVGFFLMLIGASDTVLLILSIVMMILGLIIALGGNLYIMSYDDIKSKFDYYYDRLKNLEALEKIVKEKKSCDSLTNIIFKGDDFKLSLHSFLSDGTFDVNDYLSEDNNTISLQSIDDILVEIHKKYDLEYQSFKNLFPMKKRRLWYSLNVDLEDLILLN